MFRNKESLVWCRRHGSLTDGAGRASIAPVNREVTVLPIADCRLIALATHGDSRGDFTEIFRAEWPAVPAPVQWNFVRSEANVLRGVHVHVRHHDYLTLVDGRMRLYLHDIRPWSDTAGRTCELDLVGDRLQAVAIPPGVAHGFFFPAPSAHVYSVSEYWRPDDDLACRWDSEGLAMRIDSAAPLLSRRDREAGSYAAMVREFVRRASVPAVADGA
jgi:dTDP-4-dehydrorhamnose 3,5-epimerase